MLPGIERKEPVLPTTEFYKEWLPLRGNSPTERAFTELGSLAGGAGATNVARALQTGATAGSRGALNAVQAAARNAAVPRTLSPQAGVIKMKGGNWMDNAVEEEMGGFKRGDYETQAVRDIRAVRPNLTIEEARDFVQAVPIDPSDAAANRWIDKKLTKYVKNEMATPEDPVRELIERGVSHVPRDDLIEAGRWVPDEIGAARRKAGFPELGVVESRAGSYENMTPDQRAASGWESLTDEIISSELAGVRNASAAPMRERMGMGPHPWLGKIDPNTPVYDIGGMDALFSNELGFGHLMDELRNSINPQSGLPRELLWKYSDLDKVTVPQAVERVSRINDWRAAQRAEADALKANNAATVLHKEYPEGYKWVELKQPQGLEPKDMTDNPGYQALKDALSYEGNTMGHCVGGYCDEVADGRTRIYSLRDKKGMPHTTIEVQPGKPWNERSGVFYDNPELEPPWVNFHNSLLDKGGASPNIKKFPEWLAVNEPEVFSKYEKVFGPDPDRIVQIKGKQNRAPNPEYLPYVQDFVKSGKWSDVGDLGNTGLVEYSKKRQTIPKGLTGTIPKFDEAGIPEGFYSEGELVELMRGWQNKSGDAPGYAAGGLVTYNPAEIDDRVLQLMSELESEGV